MHAINTVITMLLDFVRSKAV